MDFVVSIGGIAIVVALAWWFDRRRAPAAIDERGAMAAAAEGLPGFEPKRAAVDAAGRGALVEGRDGRLALLKPHGLHWAARLLPPGARARADDGLLIVRLPEFMFGDARLRLGRDDAGRWADRISRL